MKKLAIVNSDSMDFSYGGVAPIMKNMHEYLCQEFQTEYFYLPDSWKNFPGLGRVKNMIYLAWKYKDIKKSDFVLSHIPEGSYVISFLNIPYAHIYHGNFNAMSQSRYWFGKYFKWVFDIFCKRIEKTASVKYTVGPVWGDKIKLFNPIVQNCPPKPTTERHGFIFCGRLEKIKNIDRLIEIYSKLPDSIRAEHNFYIAGVGTQEAYLKKIVSDKGLTDCVKFLGLVSNTEIQETDSSKKLLIMASSQEGLPTAIAEALSVGVPVITTNPGDIGLVIKNGYNGCILPLDFTDSDYINAIQTVLNDYEKYASNALKSSKVFNSKTITEGVIADIQSALEKKCQ